VKRTASSRGDIHSEVSVDTTVKLYLPRSPGAFAEEDAN